MFPLLKVILITVILIVFLESCDGEVDFLANDKDATRIPQVLNRESPRNYSGPGSVLLEKSQTCYSSSDCPPWFICHNGTKCQCGPTYQNAVTCNETMLILAVVKCYCITEVDGITYAGYCFYNCGRHTIKDEHQNTYHIISVKEDVNEQICGRFNRTGISCGKCEPGLSPFVLSYNLSCVECPDSHKNWWKFALSAFAPLTLLYFIIIFFNVNVTSSRLHGYVLFSQALSTPAYVRILFIAIEDIPWLLNGAKALESFFSLWNLDPFRSILPDTCLDVDTLTAIALEACVAVYPLFLMIVSYCLIELYDRNIRCIVVIWRPFHSVFHLFREKWDIRTSVIDSFATFFLLSYVKILSVSADLLVFAAVHELPGNKTHYRIYYDASIEFFKGPHIPYALLAATLAMVFVMIPTLILILYPFRCFQKCLSYYQIQWHFLHAFIDSFQGCYKNGTEPGTRDLRWFSAYGLVLWLGICILFTLTLNVMYFIYALLLISVVVIFLVNFQPHKSAVSHYTTIEISFLILLMLHYMSVLGVNIIILNGQQYIYLIYILAFLSCFIPIIYLVFITLQWMYLKRKWSGQFLMRVRASLLNKCGS
jgi:hypothetical protein